MPRESFLVLGENAIVRSSIEALLVALATQAAERDDRRFSAAALQHIVDQGRSIVRLLHGSIGHLVHYDSTGEDDAYAWLTDLFEQLIATLRSMHRERHGLLPGDVVEVVVALPDRHLRTGTAMRIYWGYESLEEEYLISTARTDDIRRFTPG